MASALNKTYSSVKPVSSRNIHLTLKFLGRTNISDLEKIKSCLHKGLKDIHSFEYNIEDRIDAFPRLKNARIIYSAIGNGKEKIENIYKIILKAVPFMNLTEDNKKFTPHITIARIKNSFDFTNMVPGIRAKEFKNINCDRVLVYESILSEKGAEYFIIDEIFLKNKKER